LNLQNKTIKKKNSINYSFFTVPQEDWVFKNDSVYLNTICEYSVHVIRLYLLICTILHACHDSLYKNH